LKPVSIGVEEAQETRCGFVVCIVQFITNFGLLFSLLVTSNNEDLSACRIGGGRVIFYSFSGLGIGSKQIYWATHRYSDDKTRAMIQVVSNSNSSSKLCFNTEQIELIRFDQLAQHKERLKTCLLLV
jgi:hypothetical protein